MANGLELPYESTVETPWDAFSVTVSAGGGSAVAAKSFGVDDEGHGGNAISAQTDVGTVVYLISATGTGLQAEVGGEATGVVGDSRNGRGLWGQSAGVGDGVYGNSAGGAGVFGEGERCGVQGKCGSGGPAVFGEQTANGDGVQGRSATGSGIAGISHSGNGVYGRSSQGPAGYFDGDVRVRGELTCDGDLVLRNGDCAEDFDISEGVLAKPGSVMRVDADGRLVEAASAYDPSVVGVVAGAGTYQPAIVLHRQPTEAPRATIAVLGKTFCWCDASYGPIVAGDWLTSSATPSYAMKVSDPARSPGAVIGKALGSLSVGTGLVPILVCLR